MSEIYRGELRAWGMKMTMTFVDEPQTNGVAEKMVRIVKDQCIHGRVVKNLDDL